jgi:flagellar biogenesis protein FliO
MNPSPDLTAAGIKMVLVLLLLLGVLLGALYAFRRISGGGQIPGRPIRVLSSSYLGPRKVVSLVAVPGKILVLGVTKNDIRVLDRIDDPEVISRFHTPDEETPQHPFSVHLKRLLARPGKER